MTRVIGGTGGALSPIRWKLWLARPSTGRGLRTAVHGAFAACALWLGASVYGVYGARAELDSEKAGITADRRHADEVALSVRTDHERVVKADRLAVDTPDGAGELQFANEIGRFAARAGVEVTQIQIGGSSASTPGSPASADQGAQKGAAAPAPPAPDPSQASDTGKWTRTGYTCSLTGSFEALMEFAQQLESSQRIVDITQMVVRRSGVDSRTGSPRLELKLTGTMYGQSETK